MKIVGDRRAAMTREQQVAIVEAYLDCLTSKNPSRVRFAEDMTFEGPRMPKLTNRDMVLGFLRNIMFPAVKHLQIKKHIVEGEYVATLFTMETTDGSDIVLDLIHIVKDEIKAIHAFYYRQEDKPLSPGADARC
jgi:predicted ester cyclase